MLSCMYIMYLQMSLTETAEAIQAVWVENDVSASLPLETGSHMHSMCVAR